MDNKRDQILRRKMQHVEQEGDGFQLSLSKTQKRRLRAKNKAQGNSDTPTSAVKPTTYAAAVSAGSGARPNSQSPGKSQLTFEKPEASANTDSTKDILLGTPAAKQTQTLQQLAPVTEEQGRTVVQISSKLKEQMKMAMEKVVQAVDSINKEKGPPPKLNSAEETVKKILQDSSKVQTVTEKLELTGAIQKLKNVLAQDLTTELRQDAEKQLKDKETKLEKPKPPTYESRAANLQSEIARFLDKQQDRKKHFAELAQKALKRKQERHAAFDSLIETLQSLKSEIVDVEDGLEEEQRDKNNAVEERDAEVVKLLHQRITEVKREQQIEVAQQAQHAIEQVAETVDTDIQMKEDKTDKVMLKQEQTIQQLRAMVETLQRQMLQMNSDSSVTNIDAKQGVPASTASTLETQDAEDLLEFYRQPKVLVDPFLDTAPPPTVQGEDQYKALLSVWNHLLLYSRMQQPPPITYMQLGAASHGVEVAQQIVGTVIWEKFYGQEVVDIQMYIPKDLFQHLYKGIQATQEKFVEDQNGQEVMLQRLSEMTTRKCREGASPY